MFEGGSKRNFELESETVEEGYGGSGRGGSLEMHKIGKFGRVNQDPH